MDDQLIGKIIEFVFAIVGIGSVFFIGYILGWSSGYRAKLESIAPTDKDKYP